MRARPVDRLVALYAFCATTAKYTIGERGSSWEAILKFVILFGSIPGTGI